MINLIAVHSIGKQAIGYQNQLLWKLPKDMKRFKEITTGHTVVMGRKTYESIGKGLPNRANVVITRNPNEWIDNSTEEYTYFTDDIEFILSLAKDREIFIIGGETLYRQFLPYAERLYITLVWDNPPKADTFFPEYTADHWYLTHMEQVIENGLVTDFRIFNRIIKK